MISDTQCWILNGNSLRDKANTHDAITLSGVAIPAADGIGRIQVDTEDDNIVYAAAASTSGSLVTKTTSDTNPAGK